MAMKVAGAAIVLVRAQDVAPGDIVNFLLTAALYKAKAHGKAHPLAPLQHLVEGSRCWRRGGCYDPKPAIVAGEMWGSSRHPFPS